jgi:hypothetical protein
MTYSKNRSNRIMGRWCIYMSVYHIMPRLSLTFVQDPIGLQRLLTTCHPASSFLSLGFLLLLQVSPLFQLFCFGLLGLTLLIPFTLTFLLSLSTPVACLECIRLGVGESCRGAFDGLPVIGAEWLSTSVASLPDCSFRLAILRFRTCWGRHPLWSFGWGRPNRNFFPRSGGWCDRLPLPFSHFPLNQ